MCDKYNIGKRVHCADSSIREADSVMAAGGGGSEVFLLVAALRLSGSDTPLHTSHHADKRAEERQKAAGCEIASR
ncbi:hypothetical protein E2C01_038239 [Portunus trituberculatus]|uniref:Uncharacterized protein n=1 Tax=Portunus trituberculatus TaxID=210409 RepID=A0A5B7FHH0_PORTR|nr:hypothetical protein [Portunus trituberculatus]